MAPKENEKIFIKTINSCFGNNDLANYLRESKEKDLMIGDTEEKQKAGDVIPEIVEAVKSKRTGKEIPFEKITIKQAFLIGCSQAFAVFPGFSRSGTTILAGRLMGLSREAITKFTFLLSVPIIAGATVLKITDLALTKETIIGVVTSFVVGIICIKFLLKYIKKHDFSIFAFYRVIIAIIVYIKLIWF